MKFRFKVYQVENGWIITDHDPAYSQGPTGAFHGPKEWVAKTPEDLAKLIVELCKKFKTEG